MKSIKNIREENPQYNDLSDQEISDGLYSKYYSDMNKSEFEQKIGLQATQLDATSDTTEPEKKPELSELASYGFQQQLNDVEMVTKRFLAEAKDPFERYIYGSRFMGIGAGDSEFDIGKGFESATELYGSDFVWGVDPSGKKGGLLSNGFVKRGPVWNDSLTADDRLAIMADVSAKSLELGHPEVSKYLEEAELTTKQEIALGVGRAGGAITSPTTLAPVYSIAKTTGFLHKILYGAGFGFGWGTELNSAEQFMKKGEVDLLEAVTSPEAKYGALGGAVIPVLGKVVVTGTKTAAAKITKFKEYLDAIPLSDNKVAIVAGKVNEQTRKYQLEGVEDASIAVQRASDDMGLSLQTRTQIAPLVRPLTSKEIPETIVRLEAEANRRGVVSQAARTALDTKMGLKPLAEAIDYAFGVTSTRISNISEEAYRTMRRFEFRNKELSARMSSRIEPFVKAMSGLDDVTARQITKDLMNSNYDDAFLKLSGKVDDPASVFEVKAVLNELYDEGRKAGIKMPYVQDYFPRTVNKLGKLKTYLGTGGSDLDSFIKAKALSDGHIKSKLESIDGLDEDIISRYVNDFLTGRGKLTSGSGYTQSRGIPYIDEPLSEFYELGTRSLDRYIAKISRDIALKEVTGFSGDIEQSIGSIVAKTKKGLTKEESSNLTNLITSRFISGEQQMSSGLAKVRDTQTAILLAQPTAAVVQLGDLAWSVVKNGVKESWEGTLNRNLTASELGLINTVSQDIVTGKGKTTSLLKWSGFRAADRLTKDTYINAAINKARAIAKRDPEKFNEMYRRYFGDEVESVGRDLRAESLEQTPGGWVIEKDLVMTQNIKLLAFNELSDVQPISLMEMPQSYLDHPDGRIFFALKSWSIRQLDILRRDAIQKMASKDIKTKAEGVKTMMQFGLVVLPAQATFQEVREAMRGSPMSEPEELFDRVVDQAISSSVVVGNKYMADKVTEKPITTLLSSFSPAAARLGDTGYQAMKNGEIAPILRMLPWLGDLSYSWFGGGMEKKEERKRKDKIKEMRRSGVN